MATLLRIVVLGAGRMGGTLGLKWAEAGHQVAFGVRNPQATDAPSLRQRGSQVTIGQIGGALSIDPHVVVMAVPGGAMDELISAYAAQLNGRTIIDATNRMGTSRTDSLGTFQVQTPEAKVYRAFNTYAYENYANPTYNGGQGDLFYAGPQGESLAHVEQLISEVGFRPVRLGDTDQIELVNSVTALWFALVRQSKGRHIALKALTG